MPVSVKEALTRSAGLIADERERETRYLVREISFYIFRRSVEVNGSLGDTGTPLTSFSATLTTTTLIGPHLAMHYDDFSRVSR